MCPWCNGFGCFSCDGTTGGVAYTAPTVANFQTQFLRDFPYSNDINEGITPTDITNAFNMVEAKINPFMWDTQSSYNMGYLLLAAHYLVIAIRASSQGINGQFNWAQNSKSVGAVSESFTIPTRVIENPELMLYTKTTYGMQYLDLILPQLGGAIFSVCGSAQP